VKNGLPQSGNTASPTFSEKIRNPLNLYVFALFSSNNALLHCDVYFKTICGQKNNGAHY
jgi:hypothetical protein